MQEERDRIRTWVRELLDQTGLSPTALAQKAKIAPSTLHRFLNDPDNSPTPTNTTLKKLATAVGVPPIGRYSVPTGLSESEASFLLNLDAAPPKDEDPEMRLAHELAARIGGAAAHIALWRMHGRALEDAGILPGDFLVVDLNREAKTGDVVVAQFYNWSSGTAQTVFRIFEPPFLIAASRSSDVRKPELADDNRVAIKGTCIGSFRLYAHRAAEN